MNQELSDWLRKGTFFRFRQHKIFYVDEGHGECLLIFHGYPYNGYDFKYLLPRLSQQFRVIIPDMLGMGFSDKPVSYPYSFENHVAMYRYLLDYLGIHSIHVLAHDLGNSVVQELLASFEEGERSIHILSIAFLNGGLFSDVYRPRPIQVLLSQSPPFIGKLLSRLISKRSVTSSTRSVFGINTQPSQELIDDFWEILNYNQGKRLAWKIGRLVFDKVRYQQRWISAMKSTRVKMCFINGPADPNSGIHMAQRYMSLIPFANVQLLSKDIGHWPQIEAPEEVLESYLFFLQKV